MTRKKIFDFLFIWFFLSILMVACLSDYGFIANARLKQILKAQEAVYQHYSEMLEKQRARSAYLQSEEGLLMSAMALGYAKPGTRIWYFSFDEPNLQSPFDSAASDAETIEPFNGVAEWACSLMALALTAAISLTMHVFLKFNHHKER
ncbi:MAG: hypothetical protein PHI83_03705 [Sphaerochaetaceae bacterium]|jgi:hypothetical protein|nr:hypothetical protein [Sphaerochaetaceae bacterium]